MVKEMIIWITATAIASIWYIFANFWWGWVTGILTALLVVPISVGILANIFEVG